MRCLVVEDDMISRKILVRILSEHFECESAENGLEAVEMFRRSLQADRPYKLICMDIMMPVMDGQSALKAIREIEKKMNIPIGREVKTVMTTAMTDTKNVTDAFFQGLADAYLSKPVSRENIHQTLREISLIS